MPGMMDTVLNLGLNDASVEGLAKQTDDERFAYDSYRRFIAMYGRIVLDVEGDHFERLLETAKEWDGVKSASAISADTLRKPCDRYKDVVTRATGKASPQDPTNKCRGRFEAVFRSGGVADAVSGSSPGCRGELDFRPQPVSDGRVKSISVQFAGDTALGREPSPY